jgi:two-component system LytT family response regulator
VPHDSARQSLTTLIVDDEAPARARLVRALGADPRIRIIGEAVDGADAIEKIEALRPQLVFLDIQMPEVSGSDVARQIDVEPRPAIVFVTAYDEHAVKAFELAAIDYLLKPWSTQRLQEAVTRAVARDAASGAQPPPSASSAWVTRLPVRFLKRVRLVDVGDITHLISEHRVIRVYTRSGDSYWTPETLDALQARLDPATFFRTHRSSIVNLDAGLEIEPWEDGRLRVHLPHDAVVVVARDPARELRTRLGL